jgi:hypothetical protein
MSMSASWSLPMSVDSCRRNVQHHQEVIARLQQEKSRETSAVAKAAKRASDAAASASRTTIASSRQMYLRTAQQQEAEIAKHQKRIADVERKIADEHGRLRDAQRHLATAEQQEASRQRLAEARAEREHESRLRAITSKLTTHERLHRVALSAIEKLQQLPSEITVLFFAANPLDQPHLRLDEEVRSIWDMIQRSEHRDAVRLESRWAVRPLDVLQAINECQPRMVHFSGHGSDTDEIVFQDNAGNAKLVTKEAIVETMAAWSDDIQLVFFNTCFSRAQAEAVVATHPRGDRHEYSNRR